MPAPPAIATRAVDDGIAYPVRDLLALRGRMEATQISHTLHTPQPMIDAMLNQLEKMGKAVRIQEDADGCLSGSCKSCPEGKACLREWWALR